MEGSVLDITVSNMVCHILHRLLYLTKGQPCSRIIFQFDYHLDFLLNTWIATHSVFNLLMMINEVDKVVTCLYYI